VHVAGNFLVIWEIDLEYVSRTTYLQPKNQRPKDHHTKSKRGLAAFDVGTGIALGVAAHGIPGIYILENRQQTRDLGKRLSHSAALGREECACPRESLECSYKRSIPDPI